mmetsp:Transcript_8717/g.18554  ORF Transcript_8717/g.18554 Transcript_8717/m.18554 type:complete len:285 (+) Transcript_8717:226-1080(+)|eukprot:CAMPEP_0202904206 /NCGR_PEP_ID=MMETSP1392-20130828/28308_1 /ASSEMBLY_ACC=CAM_ASM_000868 /TAXON_ID=225041 /ORGANISM="Chlamydomonas chlamydogama, Strain SAG 11-48b" /LENGTH=284 /DNA_ID=CAMNT_0049591731 /DNA_START=172 /DNA_END=1026 /DNA_ORIENTATION=+
MTTSAPFISKEDVAALRDYVMGPGSQNQAESTVLLHVTHSNLQARFFEIRLDLHMTVEAVKVKLSFHCGTNPSAMLLQLLDEGGSVVATLYEDSRKLGFYSPHSGYTLHVIDTDPTSASAGGWLEDTSLVQKYMMSDDEYNKRENTYRRWKEGKLKDDPSWTLEKEMAMKRGVPYNPPAPKISDPDHLKAEAEAISVGQRCSVDPGDRRGEVMFVGQVEGLPLGYWVGIKYDEPLGKNDGTVKGKKYFEAPPGYGAFVRPDKVQVGDFPPVDEFGSDLGSEDEI